MLRDSRLFGPGVKKLDHDLFCFSIITVVSEVRWHNPLDGGSYKPPFGDGETTASSFSTGSDSKHSSWMPWSVVIAAVNQGRSD